MAERAMRRVIVVFVVLALAGLIMTRIITPRDGVVDYPSEFNALCTRVIDGDTIELLNGERVRYIGIDAPEMRPRAEPWAREATEANREMVEHEMVRLVLDVEERDQYGRLLAYVYVNDTFVNAELVRMGLARVLFYWPNVKHRDHFEELEREAQEARRGIWSVRF